MTRQETLDLYFMDVRSKLIEIAAFLDRVDRSPGAGDFRIEAFRQAMKELQGSDAQRAEKVLIALSDPSAEPIPSATNKAACGAYPGSQSSTPASK